MFKNRENFLILGLIILAELFSFSAYLVPDFKIYAFGIISLLFLILTIYKLEYGIFIALAELFIGSKGYLFALDINGINLSIRLAFWIIILAVYISQFKKIKLNWPILKPYYLLAFFVVIGLVIGIINKHSWPDLFFDFNGWLYFLLIFPILTLNSENISRLKKIFYVASAWLAVKTLFLAFAFSHNLGSINFDLYKWLRTSGVGEATAMGGGFFRIFLQSQIFIAAAFILLFVNLWLNWSKIKKTDRIKTGILSILYLSAIIFSLSRSFWLGIGISLVIISLISFKSYFIKVGRGLLIFISLLIVSLGVVIMVIKFPIPEPGNFDWSTLSNRANLLSSDSAINSRYELAKVLWPEILKHPLWGEGFGQTVTYKSNDPRVLQTSPNGLYTTYAFEWGYLDIWLKIGLFGLLSYLYLLFSLLSQKMLKYPGLSAVLLMLMVASIFTPYLNHPLGIGLLIFCTLLLYLRE